MTDSRKSAPQLLFYTTVGCHLCEEAARMLPHVEQQFGVSVRVIDIASDEALVERYGVRIPVLLNPANDRELGWPFQYQDLPSLF